MLLNPTDQKFAALISVEKGTLTVEGIRNDDKKALKKKTLGWNGRMATNLQTFMKLAAGQVGLGKLLIKILTRKVKVRGLIYFILQEKLSSFVAEQSESDVQKPLIIANKNKSLIASRLFLISGFLHIIICILAVGLLEISVTAFFFTFFVLWLSSMLNKLIKCNIIGERDILISCTTITFLNSMTYLTLILTGAAEERFYLNILMLIVIGFNIVNFIMFFSIKTHLDQMCRAEKLSYFTIVIIRGLGIGLLFTVLSWIVPPNINFIMIIYILIFGYLNMIYGNKLFNKSKDLKIQIGAVITLILGLLFAIIIFLMVIPDPKTFVNILLFCVIIPIRIYYVKKKF